MKKMTKLQLVISVCGIFVLSLLGVFFFFSQEFRSLENFCNAVSEQKKAGNFQPGTSPRLLHEAFKKIDKVAPADIHESTGHVREGYKHMLDKPGDKVTLELGMTSALVKFDEYVELKCHQ